MSQKNQQEGQPQVGSDALFSPENLKQTIYDHGGSRIYFEEGRTRKLVIDTYRDEKFAIAAREFVEKYFSENES